MKYTISKLQTGGNVLIKNDTSNLTKRIILGDEGTYTPEFGRIQKYFQADPIQLNNFSKSRGMLPTQSIANITDKKVGKEHIAALEWIKSNPNTSTSVRHNYVPNDSIEYKDPVYGNYVKSNSNAFKDRFKNQINNMTINGVSNKIALDNMYKQTNAIKLGTIQK